MRNITIFICAFLFVLNGNAQNLIDSNRLLFNPLFNYTIPGQILLDISPYSNLVQEYSNSPDSVISRPLMRKFITAFKQASKNSGAIPDLDSIQIIASKYIAKGQIPVIAFAMNYSFLSDSFYTKSDYYDSINHRLIIDSSLLQLVKSDTLYSICFLSEVTDSIAQIILPSELFFHNISIPFIKLKYNNSILNLKPDSMLHFELTDNEKLLYKKIPIDVDFKNPAGQYSGKSTLTSYEKAIPDFMSQSSDLKLRDACILFEDNEIAEARVYIKYGKAQKQDKILKKPFVLIEGFDFDLNPNDDHYGDLSFNTLINGLSISELTGELTKENLSDLKTLSAKLYELNYDLVFIDFKNGAGDLFKNGNTVIQIIQWLNEQKEGEEELIIIGASMGGLLARYALVKMEQLSCNHCTKLYGTFDSPHQGANVPLSLQYSLKFLTQNGFDTEYGWIALNSDGAKQMLIYNVASGAQQKRTEWQNWLDFYGQPKLPKRIALTNGNPDGSGPYQQGQLLYSQCFRKSGAELFKLVLFSGNPGKMASYVKIPKGKSSFSKYANTMFGRSIENLVFFPENTQYYDHVPGGQASWVADVNIIIQQYLSQYKGNKCGGPSIENNGLSTFIPTYSGLDFHQKMLNPNLKNLLPLTKRDYSSSLHPFHAIYYHTTNAVGSNKNQVHVYIDKSQGQNIDWIINQVNSVSVLIEPNLPTVGGLYSFNYEGNSDFESTVPSLTIANNGILTLYNSAKINYGLVSDRNTLDEGKSHLFRTNQCGSYIRIESGGELVLGDDNDVSPHNNKVIFRLLKGSTLELMPGASLTVFDGSILVIEEGANLIVHNNCKISLIGENANLFFKGNLVLDNAIFKLNYVSPKPHGYLKFEPQYYGHNQIITLGNQSAIELEGQISNRMRLLQVNNHHLTLSPALDHFTFSNGELLIGENGGLVLHSNHIIENSKILGVDPIKRTQGIILKGHSSGIINNCIFSTLGTGIEASRDNISAPTIFKNLIFNDCADGMTFVDGNYTVNVSQFVNCEHGILGINLRSLDLSECKFKFNRNAILISSLHSPIISVTECDFIENEMGIYVLDEGILNLSCVNSIENKTAIEVENTSIIMSGNNPYNISKSGNNTFYKNEQGIKGYCEVFMENGNNNFIHPGIGTDPIFDITIPSISSCLDFAGNLPANGNFWDPKPNNNQLETVNPLLYSTFVTQFPHPVSAKLTGVGGSSINTMCFSFPEDWKLQDNPSPTVDINPVNSDTNNIHVYPNPTSNVLNVKFFTELRNNVDVKLISASGAIAYEQQLSAGDYHLVIECSDFSVGVYSLVIKMEGQTFTKQISICTK